MPIRMTRLPPVVDFSKAGYLATFYDESGSTILASDIPMLRVEDVEARVTRTTTGVPLTEGDFLGLIPLNDSVAAAGQVLVTSIRRGTSAPYDLDEIDDNEEKWVMGIALRRRVLPIGVS